MADKIFNNAAYLKLYKEYVSFDLFDRCSLDLEGQIQEGFEIANHGQ